MGRNISIYYNIGLMFVADGYSSSIDLFFETLESLAEIGCTIILIILGLKIVCPDSLIIHWLNPKLLQLPPDHHSTLTMKRSYLDKNTHYTTV